MIDMDTSDLGGTVDTVWDVDGEAYQLVRVTDVQGDREDMVEAIRELLCCNQLEAEHVLRIIMEDGEFIASVRGDIDGLPTFDG